MSKAITLKALDRRDEASQTCDEIDRRFGSSAEPALEEVVRGAKTLQQNMSAKSPPLP